MKSKKKLIKENVMPARWPTCEDSYGKFSSHLGGIPAKSSEIPPMRAGSLLI